jgi:hypothetical protein
MTITIEDLARATLPNRGEGLLLVIECYFDDSGTHDASPVVVWGGVAGHAHYLDKLDKMWRALLQQPCEGKRPIKSFSSYDLEHAKGEFEGYNQGAKDLTRRNFRQIILESEVSVVAFGVSVKDWDQVVRGLARQSNFTAEQSVFGKAVFEIAKTAKAENEALSLHFDQGRDTPELRKVIAPTLETAQQDSRIVSYSFSKIADFPALQAADLVVHEAYQTFCALMKNPKATPRPHALQLFKNAFFGQANWVGRREIKNAVKAIERKHQKAKRASG